ncbi:protein NATD1 [Crocuta crocuta]
MPAKHHQSVIPSCTPCRHRVCVPLITHLDQCGCHDRAVLLYEYVGKRIVDLQHTEVPDAYRGRGIAKHLAKAALDFVVEEDLRAHLTCWYIQKYVKENPLPQYLERLQP